MIDTQRLGKWLALAAVAFWLGFLLAYPYHELIDDSRFRLILEGHGVPMHDQLPRPIHHGLLWLQGAWFRPSMDRAMLVSLLLHLTVGLVVWRALLPQLPAELQRTTLLGLAAFTLHPVSLQTVAHVAQRSEILGTLFVALALCVYARAVRSPNLPTPKQYAALGACGVAALLAKEPYVLVVLALVFALMLSRPPAEAKARGRPEARPAARRWSRAGLVTAGVLAVATLAGARANSLSTSLIQNDDNYARSRAFRQAVLAGREVAAADSIILPLRTPSENLRLQTALVPRLAQIVALPFALVKDYGHFPYGKATYAPGLVWLWVGVAMGLAAAALALYFRRKLTSSEWLLIGTPVILYMVYLVFPVYDPLVLYRLYGVVFLFFVVALPLLLKPARRATRWAGFLAIVVALAGMARFYEMRDPVREAELELGRQPTNYRIYVERLHALAAAGVRPLDCAVLLEPALVLAPSVALVHVEWAWCLSLQGDLPGAKAHAEKALEHELVPENVRVAMDLVLRSGSGPATFSNIHPANRKIMLGTTK